MTQIPVFTSLKILIHYVCKNAATDQQGLADPARISSKLFVNTDSGNNELNQTQKRKMNWSVRLIKD